MEFNRDKIMQQIAEVDRDSTPYESECTLLPQLLEIGTFSVASMHTARTLRRHWC